MNMKILEMKPYITAIVVKMIVI